MENQKKLTRKEQAKITKKKIYTAAIALFEEMGYDAVTIADITKRAGTARGTFYLYFDSKKDIIYKAIEIYDEIYLEAYEMIKEMPTFKEQIIAFTTNYASGVQKNGKELLNAVLLNNLLDEKRFLVVKERKIYDYLSKIIELGQKTGELSSKHTVKFYLDSIIIMFQGLDYFWCSSVNDIDISELTKNQISLMIEGMLNLDR